MTHYRRSRADGGLYFFTVVAQRRRPILTESPLRVALRASIDQVRRDQPFEIIAWVLMPDHLHCVWELPPDDHDFGTRWGRIKSGVSKACAGQFAVSALGDSKLRRRESGLWQRRFWEHRIRDDEDLRRHVDYIHWNPVKHGLVRQVADWPYSTFHRYVKEGVYAADWGGESLHNPDGGAFGE